jgi:hypothetical protein
MAVAARLFQSPGTENNNPKTTWIRAIDKIRELRAVRGNTDLWGVPAMTERGMKSASAGKAEWQLLVPKADPGLLIFAWAFETGSPAPSAQIVERPLSVADK